VSWALETRVTFSDLRHALVEAGLDASYAKELKPRNAFSRACHVLEEDRVIRKVHEDKEDLHFQFTRELEVEDAGDTRYDYEFEAVLVLNKSSGAITCDRSENLRQQAENAVLSAMSIRTTNDVTRIINRIFRDEARLLPIRPQGGAYYVPMDRIDIVDRMEDFIGRLPGSAVFQRFSADASSDPKTKRSLAQAILYETEDKLSDVNRRVEQWTPGRTRISTTERADTDLKMLMLQVEADAALLEDRADEVKKQLKAAKKRLKERALEVLQTQGFDEPSTAMAG